MANTTQEGVDGYREKAMKIASVEQVKLGNIMELSVTGHVLKWARQSNFCKERRCAKQMKWNLKNRSHMTVARHLREKSHTSMLVVTLREGEDRGLCSVALKELMKINNDQVEERSMVVFVMNKEPAIWKDSSMEALLRHGYLTYIDVEGTRVVTNNRCEAEQIMSEKVEKGATGGVKIAKLGQVGKRENSKNVVMDGLKIENMGKFENQRIPKPTRTSWIMKK